MQSRRDHHVDVFVAPRFVNSPPWSRGCARSLAPLVALACASYFGPARAERWSLDPSVSTRATYTDNAGFENETQSRGDTLLELTPAISLIGEGKKFRVRGSAAFTGLKYVNGTQDDRVLPSVDLDAHLDAIERFFVIDAGIVSGQTAQNAFGPRADGATDVNTITTTQYRVTPAFEGRLGTATNYRLSSANSWTDTSGDAGTGGVGDAYLGEHKLRIARDPSPFGWTFEGGRSETRFSTGLPERAVIDSARLTVLYGVTLGLSAGVHGGYEKTNLVIDNDKHTIYGADFDWRPTERTQMSGLWEDRFFGHAWRWSFDHRMPRVAWKLSVSRDVQTSPQSFLALGPGSSVADLLDAALTTRIPDPTQRLRAINDIITRQGLPPTVAAPTNLFSQRVSIVTSRDLSVVFLGAHNSLAIGAFSGKTEELPDSLFALVPGNAATKQVGGSITLSHQLSTQTSLTVTGTIARTEGIAADVGLESKQKALRGTLTRQLTAKSTAFVGVRIQSFNSNVAGSSLTSTEPATSTEHAAFVGLSHRF